jgi:hypothetical protein
VAVTIEQRILGGAQVLDHIAMMAPKLQMFHCSDRFAGSENKPSHAAAHAL